MQELHRARGNRDSTLEGSHKASHELGPSTKKYLHRNLGDTYIGVLVDLPGRRRWTIVHCGLKDTGSRSPREY